jgi:Lar family restriction alleviation protein
MSELLPCPFCGGEVEILTAESMNGGYLFGIMCNDCRSRGDVYDTEAEAIAAWNSRAERTFIAALGYKPIDDGENIIREEIVRCRDCEHAEESESGSLHCIGYLVEKWDYYNDEPSYGRQVEPDGFCAWAERRDA